VCLRRIGPGIVVDSYFKLVGYVKFLRILICESKRRWKLFWQKLFFIGPWYFFSSWRVLDCLWYRKLEVSFLINSMLNTSKISFRELVLQFLFEASVWWAYRWCEDFDICILNQSNFDVWNTFRAISIIHLYFDFDMLPYVKFITWQNEVSGRCLRSEP